MIRAAFGLALVLAAIVAIDATSPCADSGIVTQMTEIDGSVVDVQYAGKSRKVVFALTDQHTLWRSHNEGFDWTVETSALEGSGEAQDYFGAGIAKVFVSKPDRDRIFVQGVGRYHWISKDAGKTFEKVGTDKVLTDVMLHPTNPEYVLASAFNKKCYGDTSDDEPFCNRQLWLSRDFGKTWHKKLDFVQGYQWGKAEESVIYGWYRKGGNHQPLLNIRDAELMYTRNLWQTTHSAMGNIVGFKVMNQRVYAAKQDADGILSLFESKDDGVTIVQMEFPSPLAHHRYVIFEDGVGGVFIAILHGDGWGNVYASNGDSGALVVVLRDVPMGFSAHLDWVSAENGNVIIANVAEKGIGGEGTNTKRTVISFDRGAHWQPVKAPAGIPCKNTLGCSLHLHSGHKQILSSHPEDPAENRLGVVLSKPNAAGLILAVGNVGSSLDKDADAAHTLLSRDAGQTWSEVQAGAHVFDMGDHGGVIAMVKSYRATTHLHYNTQENGEYHTCSFTGTKAIDVTDIVTEPNGTSTRFILYGKNKDTGAGAIVHFDFQQLMAQECRGIDHAGAPDSDFELWSPSDGSDIGCLNGEKVTYTRRKSGVQCHYGAKYEKKKSSGPCPCTAEDFECNFCYERKRETSEFGQQGASLIDEAAGSVPCVWACKGKPREFTPPENCEGTYAAQTEYRKIAGNKCEGGLQLDVRRIPCPDSPGSSNSATPTLAPAPTKSKTEEVSVQVDEDVKAAPTSSVVDKISGTKFSEDTAATPTPEESASGSRTIFLVLLLLVVGAIIAFFVYTNKSSVGGGWTLNVFGRSQYSYAKLNQRLESGDLLDDDMDDEDPVDSLENAALASIGGGGRTRGGLDCRVLG